MATYKLLNEYTAIEYTNEEGTVLNPTTEEKIQYELFGLPANVKKSVLNVSDELAFFTAKNQSEAYLVARRYIRNFKKLIPVENLGYIKSN